jgi:hypothetical protein
MRSEAGRPALLLVVAFECVVSILYLAAWDVSTKGARVNHSQRFSVLHSKERADGGSAIDLLSVGARIVLVTQHLDIIPHDHYSMSHGIASYMTLVRANWKATRIADRARVAYCYYILYIEKLSTQVLFYPNKIIHPLQIEGQLEDHSP